MAKGKCPVCNARMGKRVCSLKDNTMICPVCCAKLRDETTCFECKYFEKSTIHDHNKQLKATSKISSVFGSPEMQKSIMEASIDLMNNHPDKGKLYDKDAELFREDSYNFFNTPEFEGFEFNEKDIKKVFAKFGKREFTQEWFFSEEGTEYFTKSTEFIVDELKFRSFSQDLFRIFLKYYTQRKTDESWIILGTINRLMEGEFVIPFTTLMFFRGLSKYKDA
ncbi:MAG: hypothetical protein JXR48_18865 [Candidatus Delongbacteria bacterium]|nr:hypothetical protein [Candidatus Delongbacteria bacterium]MBN2837022.1 hypothetical protein [Candidatus Delongbacteria bacterium]